MKAEHYLKKQLDQAVKIVERTKKLNSEGKVVGARAEILLRISPQEVVHAILWTDGLRFNEIHSARLNNVLEFEKAYKY